MLVAKRKTPASAIRNGCCTRWNTMDTTHRCCRTRLRPGLVQMVANQTQPSGHQNQENPEALHSVHPPGAIWIQDHGQVFVRALRAYL